MNAKEIAKICNVSTATVSNILNGKPKASKETIRKVMEIVDKYNYKPNPIAQGLRTKITKTIGIIVEDIVQFTSPYVLDGIIDVCEKSGYRVIVENLRRYSRWGDEWYEKLPEFQSYLEQAIDDLRTVQIDGAIYIAGHTRKIENFSEKIGVPNVISYAFSSDTDITSVQIDDVKGSYELTKYIIDMGHKNIGFIGGDKDNIHTIRRFEGYQKAILDAGMKFEKKWIAYGKWDRTSGYECAKQIGPADITAVVCCNDLMSGGFYDYADENKLIVGKDISIGSFDNHVVAEYFKPGLTTMQIDLGLIGRTSAKKLLEQLENPEEYKNEEIFIPTKLIERGSVAKLEG